MNLKLKSTSTEAVIKTFSRTRKAIITLHISFYVFLKPKIEYFLLVLFVYSLLEKLAKYPIFFDIGGQVSRTRLLNFRNTATETFSFYVLARAHRLVVLNQFMCTPAAIGGLITRGFDYLPVMYSGWSTYEILGRA